MQMKEAIEHTHFELSFSASVLKKAQTLYSTGACERLHAGQALGSHFLVGDEDVRIKRKQKKITEAVCSCEKSPLCAHVAAALFYLDGIQLSQVPVNRKNSETTANSLLKELQALNEKGTRYFHDHLASVSHKDLRRLLIFYLGAHEGLESDEKTSVVSKLEKKLQKNWNKRMPEASQVLWFEALKLSLRSNTIVAFGAYRFLLLRFLVAKHSALQLAEIEKLVTRRNFKRFHHDGPDYLSIAAHQIKLSSKSPRKAELAELSSLEVLAYCELLITENKQEKAKKLLLFVLEIERSSAQLFGSKLLYYAMQCAQALSDKEVIRAVLIQRLRESVQADESVLHELREMSSANEFKAEMLKLALATHNSYTEKKAILLIKSGDRKAMIDFAKMQALRYHLLIQILTEALPLMPSNIVPLLAGNITEALRQSPRLEWQSQVLKQCTPYLKSLALSKKNQVLERVQANLGEQSHLALLLQKLMD